MRAANQGPQIRRSCGGASRRGGEIRSSTTLNQPTREVGGFAISHVPAFAIHQQPLSTLRSPPQSQKPSRCTSSDSSVKFVSLSTCFVGLHSGVGCLRKKKHPSPEGAPALTRLSHLPQPACNRQIQSHHGEPCRPSASPSKPPPLASSASESGPLSSLSLLRNADTLLAAIGWPSVALEKRRAP
jgi:hypothetical protein